MEVWRMGLLWGKGGQKNRMRGQVAGSVIYAVIEMVKDYVKSTIGE
jgi:hypothetical protein